VLVVLLVVVLVLVVLVVVYDNSLTRPTPIQTLTHASIRLRTCRW
jgi:hypothetical protein